MGRIDAEESLRIQVLQGDGSPIRAYTWEAADPTSHLQILVEWHYLKEYLSQIRQKSTKSAIGRILTEWRLINRISGFVAAHNGRYTEGVLHRNLQLVRLADLKRGDRGSQHRHEGGATNNT